MASYHVFIERPRDVGATAAARLAAAVADRYGIPAATLVERLATGRLRVKTGVDLATAETFAADLESLGAVCSIVDAATNERVVSAPASAPAPVALPPRANPASSSSSSPFSSALSAARVGPDAPQQDLGALSSGEFALATLDGADDQGGAGGNFGPPADDALPASMGPAILPASMGPAIPPPSIGDAFAPPDAEPELALLLDMDRPERKVGTTAPAVSAPITMASTHEDPAPVARGAGLAGWVRDARLRFAGGVLIAVLVGFVPASLVTSMREGSAFAEIDEELSQTYRRADDEREWLRLDDARARAITHKQEARRDIALASILLWTLVTAGIAYLWFRVVDWDALAARF